MGLQVLASKSGGICEHEARSHWTLYHGRTEESLAPGKMPSVALCWQHRAPASSELTLPCRPPAAPRAHPSYHPYPWE